MLSCCFIKINSNHNLNYSIFIPRTKRMDDTVDRRQGSTYIPDFRSVNIQKPTEYQRPLTVNDVSKIRLVKFFFVVLF
jgi:hypothetical protein